MEKRKEKRLRLKLQDNIKEDRIMINEKIAKDLEITDKVEIVVGGKKRLVLNAILSSDISPDQAIINSTQAKINGIADNTIATIRRA